MSIANEQNAEIHPLPLNDEETNALKQICNMSFEMNTLFNTALKVEPKPKPPPPPPPKPTAPEAADMATAAAEKAADAAIVAAGAAYDAAKFAANAVGVTMPPTKEEIKAAEEAADAVFYDTWNLWYKISPLNYFILTLSNLDLVHSSFLVLQKYFLIDAGIHNITS